MSSLNTKYASVCAESLEVDKLGTAGIPTHLRMVLQFCTIDALTIDSLEVSEHPFEMLEADAGGIFPGDEQLEGVLRGLPLVQEEPPELLFLDAGEGVVDDRQHEVHQEVEVDGEVPGRGRLSTDLHIQGGTSAQ